MMTGQNGNGITSPEEEYHQQAEERGAEVEEVLEMDGGSTPVIAEAHSGSGNRSEVS